MAQSVVTITAFAIVEAGHRPVERPGVVGAGVLWFWHTAIFLLVQSVTECTCAVIEVVHWPVAHKRIRRAMVWVVWFLFHTLVVRAHVTKAAFTIREAIDWSVGDVTVVWARVRLRRRRYGASVQRLTNASRGGFRSNKSSKAKQ